MGLRHNRHVFIRENIEKERKKGMKNKKIVALMVMSFGALATLASCGKESDVDYTLSTYLDANPKTWNSHAWETNSDSYILAYTEMGFYDLGFNDEKTGYKFLTEMASDFPKDVTSELSAEEKAKYFGRSSINLTSGIAYDIKLNDKATWEDGTKIVANDYVESMKRLLDPEMVNHRADSWYKGTTILANAEAYFKNGQVTIEPAYSYIKDSSDLSSTDPDFCYNDIWYINIGADSPYAGAIFSNVEEGAFYTVLNNRSSKLTDDAEAAATRITDAVLEGLIKIRRDGILGTDKVSSDWKNVEKASDITEDMRDYDIQQYEFDQLELKVSGTKIVAEAELKTNGEDLPASYTSYTWENLKADIQLFVQTLGYPRGVASKTNAWRLPLFAEYDNHTGVTDFGQVGIEAIDDYTLRLVMASDKPVSLTDLEFSLTSSWLVDTELYDKLTTTVAGTSLKATKYGTDSAANYKSFGPYKLSNFQSNKLIEIVKNDNWYGWTDGNHVGQFQTEKITTEIIDNHTTAMQKFENGEIDDIELTASDMKKYGSSSRLQYTPTSYTSKMSFNVDRNQLLKRQKNAANGSHAGNKTIMANEDFRKAISLGIDRVSYASQCTAGSQAFYGLLNNLYISDVNNGEYYRGTSQAKGVYDKIYGHLGGTTIDETDGQALDSKHVGYNSALAAEYLARAIETEDEATDEGHFSKGDTVAMEILVYKSDSETTIASYNFIKSALDSLAAAVNEKFGSKVISFDYYMTENEDYYNEAKQGKYDIIFSTWGGAQMNPWGLMEVYCDTSFDSNCEYGMTSKIDKIDLTFDSNGDGVEETKSIAGWYSYMSALTDISSADYDMEDPDDVAKYEADYKARHEEKLTVLSELEAGYVNTWSTLPLYARSSASLTSFKVSYGSEEYIPLMGYGGIRYMTFNFTDKQWSEKISSGEINSDLYKQ